MTPSILSEKITENLDNAYESGRMLAMQIRAVSMDQKEILTNHGHHFNDGVRSFMLDNYDQLEEALVPDRDLIFMYKSLKTLQHNYLFKVDGVPREGIQWCWMRVAVQVSMPVDGDPGLEEVIENYHILSKGEAIHATPTCVNAGYKQAQLESCFLVPMGDSMEDIQAARTIVAMGSKANGGFGLDCGNIRHGRVGNRGITKGVPGLLKHEFDPLIGYADQLGSRPGALTAFLPMWHIDIETFVRMGDRKSPESIRATNINYSLWVHDLFHVRRLSGGDWHLFCPRETKKLWLRLNGGDDNDSKAVDQAKSLHDMWGQEFEDFYLQCEKHINGQKIDPRHLWEKICIQRCQIGQPFVMNADAANRKSNQMNQGTITQSNLCVTGDTLLLTNKGNIPIKDIIGQEVQAWNGQEWSTITPVQTGVDQELLTVSFSNGSIIKCTKYHRFYLNDGSIKRSSELMPGEYLITWTGPDNVTHEDVSITAIHDYGHREDTFCAKEPLRGMLIFNGIISSNCMEILQYTKPGEVAATCDLATLNLVSYLKSDGSYDWHRLGAVTRQLVRNLDRVIDVTSGIITNDIQKVLDKIIDAPEDDRLKELALLMYPDIKKDITYTGRRRNRAIGIGKMGLGSLFSMMDLKYGSDDACILAETICACIYWHAMDESSILAKKHGSYGSFHGSPASMGLLQPDLWAKEDEEFRKMNINGWGQGYMKRREYGLVSPSSFGVGGSWDDLRSRVKEGLRHSLVTCQMPNATTASIWGVTPSIEPIFSCLHATSNVQGNDTSIYHAVVDVAKKKGVYDPIFMAKYLASNHGSMKGIHEIDMANKDVWLEIEDLFTRAFDVNKKRYFIMVQRMGRYICQSQSLNWFFELPNDKYMERLDTLLWANGAKTGQYYVHRKAVANAVSTATFCTKDNSECTSCQ